MGGSKADDDYLQNSVATNFVCVKIYLHEKRSDKNGDTSAVVGFSGVIDDSILPPAAVELCREKEHLIWNQFSRARQGRLA